MLSSIHPEKALVKTYTGQMHGTRSMLIKEFNSSWTWLRQSDVLNIKLSSWGTGQWVSKEYSLFMLTFISPLYSPGNLYCIYICGSGHMKAHGWPLSHSGPRVQPNHKAPWLSHTDRTPVTHPGRQTQVCDILMTYHIWQKGREKDREQRKARR